MSIRSRVRRLLPTRRGAPLALAALLAACGGGGGDPPGEAGRPEPPALVVSGSVVKSPVAGARVCASWLAEGAPDPSTTACVSSAADGGFSLQLPRRAALLLVEASGGDYLDEADPAARVTLTRLRSVVPVDDGPPAGRTVQLSALTELAARRALARGGFSAEAAAAATTEVERAFGVTGLHRIRPADLTARVDVTDTPALLYGLANAGVRGWMAERGVPAAALDDALAELASRLGAGTLHEQLAAFRAGMRRVILAHPASGLGSMATAWSSVVALDFGDPPPAPARPLLVEQPGTLRFAVRWELTDLLGATPAPMCLTNVPAGASEAQVRAAAQRAADVYAQRVSGLAPVARCIGGGQSVTVDFNAPDSPVWGDEG